MPNIPLRDGYDADLFDSTQSSGDLDWESQFEGDSSSWTDMSEEETNE